MFSIITEKFVYEMCSIHIYMPQRKLKSKGWPEGKTWIVGMIKTELKKLGLEVFDTCNINGSWHYLVDEAKAVAILEKENN